MGSNSVGPLPMAREGDGLVVRELPDETLVYDTERHDAYCLNRTAALVWKHCDGKNGVAEIARLVGEESGTPVGEDLVWLALDRLGEKRLLHERVGRAPSAAGMSRRDFSRKVTLGAALALPTILMLSTSASAQASCRGEGEPCGSDTDCCGFLTCSDVCV